MADEKEKKEEKREEKKEERKERREERRENVITGEDIVNKEVLDPAAEKYISEEEH